MVSWGFGLGLLSLRGPTEGWVGLWVWAWAWAAASQWWPSPAFPAGSLGLAWLGLARAGWLGLASWLV